MNSAIIFTLISEVVGFIGVITPMVLVIRKILNGIKCHLRSDMLDIYHANRETKTIRQYDYENFVLLYEAYKALKGNSFIDKIYSEVKTWEIVP